ncbi:MAG: tRNA (adenosine(37)-N6)-dimethylallyltransferase MiaA, partial [Muribaculaceae bacterium]|nr:tRNA (adenosine(37)-N6)-dimethylallyltransferase MiaA [Muribaculaceae bacterium]
MFNVDSVTIMGPTASGKTSKAVALARALKSEIISGDSRQVYTGMDLGTGKDLDEYGEIPYHLIDVLPAGDKYDLHRYVSDFQHVYSHLIERGLTPVICGGSGLYVETVLSGVRLPDVPENKELRESLRGMNLKELTDILSRTKKLHNITDVDTCQRAIRAIEIQRYYIEHPDEAAAADRQDVSPLNSLIVALDIARDERRERISSRLRSRLANGMVEEVKKLMDSGVAPDNLIYYGLEYKFLTLYLIGQMDYDEMVG